MSRTALPGLWVEEMEIRGEHKGVGALFLVQLGKFSGGQRACLPLEPASGQKKEGCQTCCHKISTLSGMSVEIRRLREQEAER